MLARDCWRKLESVVSGCRILESLRMEFGEEGRVDGVDERVLLWDGLLQETEAHRERQLRSERVPGCCELRSRPDGAPVESWPEEVRAFEIETLVRTLGALEQTNSARSHLTRAGKTSVV